MFSVPIHFLTSLDDGNLALANQGNLFFVTKRQIAIVATVAKVDLLFHIFKIIYIYIL
jgi:hypothetical protein